MSCVAGGREPRTQEREQCGQGVEELLPKTGPWGNLDAGSIGVRPKVGGAYRRVVHIAAPQGAHTGDTQWKAQSMSANGKDIKKQTTALTAMGTHDTMTVHKAKNMVPHNENKMLLRMVTKRKK